MLEIKRKFGTYNNKAGKTSSQESRREYILEIKIFGSLKKKQRKLAWIFKAGEKHALNLRCSILATHKNTMPAVEE